MGGHEADAGVSMGRAKDITMKVIPGSVANPFIKAHHYSGKVAVSFSGGKDSTVLLDLARRAFPDIPAVFVDTGLEYPEIREFVKTVPNVTWLRPEMPFSKVISEYGYPVISKDVARRIRYARKGGTWALCHLNGLNRDGTP